MSTAEIPAAAAPRRRWLLFAPLVTFVLLAALLLVRLWSGDPSRLPSALIGRPAPHLDLPSVQGLANPGLRTEDLKSGHVSLVNIFASWCAECHEEHDALMRLAQDPALRSLGMTLDGIAYKDNAEDTRRYLDVKGNPYRDVGSDVSGRAGIELGVYGVPETFVIKGDGTIAFKLVGGVTAQTAGTLMAEIERASR